MLLLLVGVGLLGSPLLNYTQSSSSINWANIHGVQYRWSPLMTEDNITNKAPPPSISFPQMEANGLNEIRVFISWSWYEANQSAFLNYLQELATEADITGLNVVYSPYGTNGLSQSWGFNSFPSYLTNQYANPSAFWNAWLADQVTYGGTSGWDLQLQFMAAVIHTVDSHPSTLAYEIMNEPETPNYQYSELSAYQTYIAQHISRNTSNWIMFMGPYKGGHVTGTSPVIQSAPSLTISKLVFDGHDYANGSYVPTIAQVTSTLHVPGIVGEFSICSAYFHCPTTQSGVSAVISNYMSLFKQYGLGSDFYAWQYGPTNQFGYYQNLLDYKGNQWWLDSLLAVQPSTSTTSTSTATSTVTTTSVSKSSTSTMTTSTTSLTSSTTTVLSSSSTATTTKTSTTTTSLTTTTTTTDSSATTTTSTFSCTSPATATKSGVTITLSSNCFNVGGAISGVVTGLKPNQAYRVYDTNGNVAVEKVYFNSNSSGDLTFSLAVLKSMLTNSSPTINRIHVMFNTSPWSEAVAINILVSS